MYVHQNQHYIYGRKDSHIQAVKHYTPDSSLISCRPGIDMDSDKGSGVSAEGEFRLRGVNGSLGGACGLDAWGSPSSSESLKLRSGTL